MQTIGCVMYEVVSSMIRQPFLGGVQKASKRMGFSASSNFFLDA